MGTGSIGMKHCDVLKTLDVPFVVMSSSAARLEEMRKRGFTTATTIAEARNLGVRAIIIANESQKHVSTVKESLDYGLHVLCEKPLALDAEKAEELDQKARNEHRELYVACCLRYDKGIQYAKQLLPELGKIHSARFECRSYLPDWRPDRDHTKLYSAREGSGGVLLDLIHEVDLSGWLLGHPDRVTGILTNTGQLSIDAPERADAILDYSDGPVVYIGLDYLTRTPQRGFDCRGEKGMLNYDYLEGKLTFKHHEEQQVYQFDKEKGTMYIEQMKDFVRIIHGEAPERLAKGEDGVRALRICDAWQRSHSNGTWEAC